MVVFLNMSHATAILVKEDRPDQLPLVTAEATCPAAPKANRIRPPLPVARLNKLRRTLFMDDGIGSVQAERSQE